jgi:protease IV
MDRNRKILTSILALLLLSLVMAIIDVGMNVKESSGFSIERLDKSKKGPGIGIVRIDGPIEMSGQSSPFGISGGAEDIINRINNLMKNSDVKAIVIKINTPGGTVAATQEIYNKIWKLRKKNIPVIASMGDIAASGGYYIASACDTIYANYGTITGSIGVIALSPNLKKLFEKLGIKMNIIKSGKYKDILASHRDLSKEERILLQEMIDQSYNKFLKDIALGRNMNQSDIEPYADGRVMTGELALKVKLIDALGTYEDAIDYARKVSKLPADSAIYDDVFSPLQQFQMMLEGVFKGSILSKFTNQYRLEYRYTQ